MSDEHEAIDSLLATLADIRHAAGDPEGRIMLSDLADHIRLVFEEHGQLREKVRRLQKQRDELNHEAFEDAEQAEWIRCHMRRRVARLRGQMQTVAKDLAAASSALEIAASPEPGDRATGSETGAI